MIEEIVIRDLGVIAEATLPLGPGFTALTGETGAGKTMVVTALGLLLGERADSGTVRADSARSVAEGHWIVPADGAVAERVDEAGGMLDDVPAGASAAGAGPGSGAGSGWGSGWGSGSESGFGSGSGSGSGSGFGSSFGSSSSSGSGAVTGTGAGRQAELVISRTVSAEGRSRAAVGGRSVPVGLLAELGEHLVVVHGQSEQIRLKSATAQRRTLDRFGGAEVAEALRVYGEAYDTWEGHRAELDRLIAADDEREAEAEALRQALEEIEKVAPEAGEDAALAERAEKLTNLEELRLAASLAREAVSAEESERDDVVALLAEARRQLDRVSAHDPQLQPLAEAVQEAGYLVADIAGSLSSYLAGLEPDGAIELESVQERRAALSSLMRAHGPTLEEVLRLGEHGAERLLELEAATSRVGELRAALEGDEESVARAAASVTALRRAAAERLGDAVTAELSALAMPDARFGVEVDDRGEYTADGRDRVRMLLTPHAGAEPRALGRGASGGELSRLMLAIEVVIAETDPVPTFVFDEIDAGVGGAAAIEIGRRLAALARHAQVIVVTHLAQVAAFANNHLIVVKDGDGRVTTSSVRRLEGDERLAEMTRLLSGLTDSVSGTEHARELLELAATS